MWRRPRLAEARQRLVRAQELFQRGDFAAAAALFEELAQGAEAAGMLDRAGDLRLQAGRCYLQLKDVERADQQGVQALHLFLRAGRPQKVRRLLPRMLAVLEQHGRREEAQELRRKAEQLLGPLPVGAGPGIAGLQANLPGKCPNCGGPLRPNEVNWVGPRSAECPYCGGVVPAT